MSFELSMGKSQNRLASALILQKNSSSQFGTTNKPAVTFTVHQLETKTFSNFQQMSNTGSKSNIISIIVDDPQNLVETSKGTGMAFPVFYTNQKDAADAVDTSKNIALSAFETTKEVAANGVHVTQDIAGRVWSTSAELASNTAFGVTTQDAAGGASETTGQVTCVDLGAARRRIENAASGAFPTSIDNNVATGGTGTGRSNKETLDRSNTT